MNIQVSTKVCSFGKQVVEKLETEYPQVQHNGRYLYKIARSPMCEYMVNFIHKLKHLPEKYMMNSVLENFTILQVNISSYKSQIPTSKLSLICNRFCITAFGFKNMQSKIFGNLFSINVNYFLYTYMETDEPYKEGFKWFWVTNA